MGDLSTEVDRLINFCMKKIKSKNQKNTQNRAIGLRIQMARKEAGLNQEELSKKVGVNRTTLANWETGKFELSNENLLNVSRILGKSMSYFFGEEQRNIYNEVEDLRREVFVLREEVKKYRK
jgi:transcriptional regulator with XRE-family HTH domain